MTHAPVLKEIPLGSAFIRAATNVSAQGRSRFAMFCGVSDQRWNAPETTDMAKSCAVECLASGYDRFGRAGVVSGKRCTLGWKSGPLDTTGLAGPAMFEAKGCTFG